MITRIELQNFMSHAETVIEPAAGLTVLVGPNNVGKSAIVAALKILCRNENSTYVMRHGERECAIILDTGDGHHVEWRRKTSPSYLIDGQKFDRLRQGGLPDELHQALRLPTVDSGEEDDFDIHFGTQKTPIFLLNSPPAVAARFFASSSDAIRLVEIQRRHKAKLAERQAEKSRLEKDSQLLEVELEALRPVAELDDRLRAVEHDHVELSQGAAWLKGAARAIAVLAEQAARQRREAARAAVLDKLTPTPILAATAPLQKRIDDLEAAQHNLQIAQRRAAALADLPKPPTLEPTAALTTLIANLRQGEQDRRQATAVADALSDVPAPPKLHDLAALDRVVKRLAQRSQDVERGSACAQRFTALTSPPPLDDAAALREQIDRRAQAERRRTEAESRREALSPLAPPPSAVDVAPLAKLVQNWLASVQRIENDTKTVRAVTEDFAAAERELRAAAAESTCSACGSPLDPDRVISRAGSGLRGGHDHA